MALRFVDSFDHYVTADLGEKWTSASSITINSGSGRRGTASAQGGVNALLTKTLDAQATWIVGLAFKISNLPGTTNELIELLDVGSLQCELQLLPDGTLRITRNGTTLGTSTFALSAGVYYYIEFKVFINNTTGTAEVKVDGSSKLALTSQDTQNTANATANQVRLRVPDSNSNFDDLYICDGAGSTNNNFLGDCRVDYYAPNGAGNTTQLTRGGTDSGANWSQTDEAAPNDDTDYNEHATVGNKDTYAFGNMSHTPSSIFGVQILASAKKDDAGAKSIATVTRSGTTDFDGATQALSTSYLYYSDIREVDPNTSAAWTKTNFDASEHGVKVAA